MLFGKGDIPAKVRKSYLDGYVQLTRVDPGPEMYMILDGTVVRQMTVEEKELYYPIPFEVLQQQRLSEIEEKTQLIYQNGTPAYVHGVEYRFDTQYGQRSAVRWLTLDSVIVRGLMSPESVAPLFPIRIEALHKQFAYLNDVAEANRFYVELMQTDTAIASVGADIQAQVLASTTKEELDLIVDTRPDTWPFQPLS